MRIKELEIELLKARLEAMEARHKAEAASPQVVVVVAGLVLLRQR